MVEIACAVITSLASVLVAYIGFTVKRQNTEIHAESEQKLKLMTIILDNVRANTELTVGVAYALKNGHCNGEVEHGLDEVSRAKKEYDEFMREITAEKMM